MSKLEKKPDFVNALIATRKKAFEANSELESQFAREAEELACGGKSTKENRREELQRKFFTTKLEGRPGLTDYRCELT